MHAQFFFVLYSAHFCKIYMKRFISNAPLFTKYTHGDVIVATPPKPPDTNQSNVSLWLWWVPVPVASGA